MKIDIKVATLTLNPALDEILYVKKLKRDDSNPVEETAEFPGGNGVNISGCLYKLGIGDSIITITMLGGNNGSKVIELLRNNGLCPITIGVKNETRRNIILRKISTGEQSRLHRKGAKIHPEEYNEMKKLIYVLGQGIDIFVLTGSLPADIENNAYHELILLLKKANPKIKIILDTDKEPLKYGLSAKPYLVKPNIHEVERLTGIVIKSFSDKIDALKNIYALGPEIVVISLGKDGVIAYDGNQIIEVKPPKIDRVMNTVGAGDSLVAGMIYKMNQGEISLEEILKFGVKVSSANVTSKENICGWQEINSITEEPQVIIHKNF